MMDASSTILLLFKCPRLDACWEATPAAPYVRRLTQGWRKGTGESTPLIPPSDTGKGAAAPLLTPSDSKLPPV